MSRASILVVEADGPHRAGLVKALGEADYSVSFATDAESALRVLARQPVDLVIAEQRLEGLDGHAFLSELSRRHPTVGTVLLASLPSRESEERARRQGVLAYLQTPLPNMSVVPRIIEAALELHRKRMGTA